MNIRITSRQNFIADSFVTQSESVSGNSRNSLGSSKSIDSFEIAKPQKYFKELGDLEINQGKPEAIQDAIRAQQLGLFLGDELKKYGIEMDQSALTALSSVILKGGTNGVLTALAATYGIAKLAMGPPASEGVAELLSSLAANPEQTAELVTPMISDPEFYPISPEQVEIMANLSAMPFGKGPGMISQFLGQIIQSSEPPQTKAEEDALQKLDQMIPIVIGSVGTGQPPPTNYEVLFK